MIIGIDFIPISLNGENIDFFTVYIGLFILNDNNEMTAAKLTSDPFCDERVIYFSAAWFYWMIFFFMGGA